MNYSVQSTYKHKWIELWLEILKVVESYGLDQATDLFHSALLGYDILIVDYGKDFDIDNRPILPLEIIISHDNLLDHRNYPHRRVLNLCNFYTYGTFKNILFEYIFEHMGRVKKVHEEKARG